MALTSQDITRIANLARLELSTAEGDKLLGELNDFFAIVQTMQAVDTTGVTPLAHPFDVVAAQALRLREDCAQDVAAARDANMANAPAAQDGLFLVPKVIE